VSVWYQTCPRATLATDDTQPATKIQNCGARPRPHSKGRFGRLLVNVFKM
jgi:hypothetical protein